MTKINEQHRVEFLNLFNQIDRPAVSKIFFDLVRSKKEVTIGDVVNEATKKRATYARSYNMGQVKKMDTVIKVVTNLGNEITVRQYIDFLYEWEKLTPQEKEQQKNKREDPEKDKRMAQYPPSEAQLSYLANLGYDGEPPANMHEASVLIDQMTRR
jgi:hypothetical protein